MKNKKIQYNILVWSGGYNFLTKKGDGDVDFFDPSESKEALDCYRAKVKEGYFESYITVKKETIDDVRTLEEYGNEMADCVPMCYLPKYIKKQLGEIVDLVCDNDDLVEQYS